MPKTKRQKTQGLTWIGLIIVILVALFNLIPHGDSTSATTPTAQVPTTVPPTVIPSLPPVATVVPQDGNTPTSGQVSSWLQVYFTNPNPPDQVGSGVDQIVVPEVEKAQRTIDVTSFDLNLPSFVNALVAAQQRGVQVRVVYDGKNGNQKLDAAQSPTGSEFDAISVMQSAGISLVDDGRSNGLMHNKMIIIDGNVLFMGSWNMSYNDTFRNNNNLLMITDPTLIANYQAKFNELFVNQRFGTKATVGAQTPQLNIGGIEVFNYFSPVDHVMDKLVALVNGAQRSVRFMIFTYTDQELADAMINRYKAGVDVSGVIESRGSTQGSLVALACAKVPVKTDGNQYTMHHKVIIIDDSIVVTGSFNFTKSADDANDDNVLIIYDPTVAQQYIQEFDRVNSIAKSPDTSGFKCP